MKDAAPWKEPHRKVKTVVWRCFVEKKKNFEKFTGKHLYQGLFFNKVVGWSGIFQNTFFYRKEKYFWMLETEIQERI